MEEVTVLYTRDGTSQPENKPTNSNGSLSRELSRACKVDEENGCENKSTAQQPSCHSRSVDLVSSLILSDMQRRTTNPTTSLSGFMSTSSATADGLLPTLGYSILTSRNETESEVEKFPVKHSESPFGPMLAVHSNEYVEQRRSNIRGVARLINDGTTRLSPFHRTKEGIFAPNDEKVYFRPEWPFHSWEQHNFRSRIDPDVFLSEHDPYINPHQRTTEQKIRGEHVLQDILQCDPSDIDFHFVRFLFKQARASTHAEHCNEYSRIVGDVRTILRSTCEVLAKKHKIFENFVIIEMGSMGEGTKIGDPNEFDFMIELPLLDEAVRAELPIFQLDKEDGETRNLVLTNRDLLADFERLNNSNDGNEDEQTDDKDVPRMIWNIIQCELAEVMECVTPHGWKWLDTAPPYMSGPALTQTLLWKGRDYPKLFVHLDICLCFKPSYFDSKVDWNQDVLDKTRPGIRNPVSKKRIGMKPVYLILRADGTARWTRALQEKQIWSIFSEADGRKRTYRCLKFAISKFMYLKYNDAQFRLDPAIPSYWIKTVLYYLMVFYHEDQYWTEDFVQTRFVEAFLILKKCLTDRVLSSFFVPRNLLSKVITNEELDSVLARFCFLSDRIVKSQPPTTDVKRYSEVADQVQCENDKEFQKGLFLSVIELCYFYGYNDFSDETFKALQSFVETYIADDVRLSGEGSDMEMWYKETRIEINEHINKQYHDEKKYFGSQK